MMVAYVLSVCTGRLAAFLGDKLVPGHACDVRSFDRMRTSKPKVKTSMKEGKMSAIGKCILIISVFYI